MDLWSAIVAFSLGLGLSAACGFRVFIPLLAMGVGARAGLIELGESWAWMSETWVIAAFAAATLLPKCCTEYGVTFPRHSSNLRVTFASTFSNSLVLRGKRLGKPAFRNTRSRTRSIFARTTVAGFFFRLDFFFSQRSHVSSESVSLPSSRLCAARVAW